MNFNGQTFFRKDIYTIFVLLFFTGNLFAYENYLHLEIVPNHDNWTYNLGEKVSFTIRVVRAGITVKNTTITYQIGLEKMKPDFTKTKTVKNGVITVEAGTLKNPGFLTCKATTEIDGMKYEEHTTVGFNPEKIQPTTTLPKDFKQFWDKAIQETSQIPMEPMLTYLPERSTPKYKMYHVRLQHYKMKSYIYGLLCIPTSPGKHPAVLKVPGAGVKKDPADTELAEKGFITLLIGINGIPYTMDDEVYNSLQNGVLADYPFIHLDDKDHYYYRRVYTGCIRAIDFIYTLPEFDGVNLGVSGGSQGGALTIVTAGLDKRVKALVAFYPALCDLTGYLHGRAGGWPAMFAPENAKLNNKPEKIETSKYFDVVNFARLVTAPGYYSFGYNDPTCPPTSTFSAYNVVTAPKKLFIAYNTGHWRTTEQQAVTQTWLINQLRPDK